MTTFLVMQPLISIRCTYYDTSAQYLKIRQAVVCDKQSAGTPIWCDTLCQQYACYTRQNTHSKQLAIS